MTTLTTYTDRRSCGGSSATALHHTQPPLSQHRNAPPRRRDATGAAGREPGRRKPPSRIVLDIDPTDVEMRGSALARLLRPSLLPPAVVVCGRHTLGVVLRAGNAGPMEGAVAELERIVSRIRARWPGTEFVVRADAGYGKDELMSWCEARGVHYILGLAKNKRLVEAVGWELADAEAECEAKGRAARRCVDFEYATRKTWSKKRRVVGKAEWLPGKANPRFIATSLPRSMVRARTLYYEHLYCGRGRMERDQGAAAGPLRRAALRLRHGGQPVMPSGSAITSRVDSGWSWTTRSSWRTGAE